MRNLGGMGLGILVSALASTVACSKTESLGYADDEQTSTGGTENGTGGTENGTGGTENGTGGSQETGGAGGATGGAGGAGGTGGERPVAQVDEQMLPLPTCREGALYAPYDDVPMPNSIPVELLPDFPDRPAWAMTENLKWLLEFEAPLPNFNIHALAPVECTPGTLALTEDGLGPTTGLDLRIWSSRRHSTPSCGGAQDIACHPHGAVGVTWDCGLLPLGQGGDIVPGAYGLVGYVRYGDAEFRFPSLGAHIVQTLYVTETNALLVSSDDNNFEYTGTLSLSHSGNHVSFQPSCETQPSQYRAFPGDATYTASGNVIEFFEDARQIRSTFVRLPEAR